MQRERVRSNSTVESDAFSRGAALHAQRASLRTLDAINIAIIAHEHT